MCVCQGDDRFSWSRGIFLLDSALRYECNNPCWFIHSPFVWLSSSPHFYPLDCFPLLASCRYAFLSCSICTLSFIAPVVLMIVIRLFSLNLVLPLWLAARLFLLRLLRTFLAVSLCLPLPPTLITSLSLSLHGTHEEKYTRVSSEQWWIVWMPFSFSLSLSLSLSLFPRSTDVWVFPCLLCFISPWFSRRVLWWLSLCLAESHVFIWSLWQFTSSEPFSPQVTSDLHWKDYDLLLS